jgi:hypothetical protein
MAGIPVKGLTAQNDCKRISAPAARLALRICLFVQLFHR